MKNVHTFEYFLLEQELNEIGEGSNPFPWKRTGSASVDRVWMTSISNLDKGEMTPGKWDKLPEITYEFKSDKATYIVKIVGEFTRYTHISFGSKRPGRTPQDYDMAIGVAFDVVGSEKEAITNFGEQFRVVSTVTDIIESVVKEINEWAWVKLQEIHIAPKMEDAEEGVEITQSKRGRLYLEYIKKQGYRLPGDWTADIQKDRFVLKNGKMSNSSGTMIQL
jgi:hypothetical protein